MIRIEITYNKKETESAGTLSVFAIADSKKSAYWKNRPHPRIGGSREVYFLFLWLNDSIAITSIPKDIIRERDSYTVIRSPPFKRK
jgi:hypothetical protein